jgi:hypothetical protein
VTTHLAELFFHEKFGRVISSSLVLLGPQLVVLDTGSRNIAKITAST